MHSQLLQCCIMAWNDWMSVICDSKRSRQINHAALIAQNCASARCFHSFARRERQRQPPKSSKRLENIQTACFYASSI
ncbi:hypothetical protein OBBRIDRAFT_412805 [Obba rivulosa]|uniref:Uncharacterized protein n=1 Tax=Obba rivulosa TaxID=1052685 RepID=A0A8E2AJ71_9APHY|nr:hypothetical protein OBBRIDRAFT_412805 [Obba rivulosa]